MVLTSGTDPEVSGSKENTLSMIIYPIRPFLFLLCLQLLACSGDQTRTLAASVASSNPDLPGRRDLSRQFRQEGEVLVVYSAGCEPLRAVASRLQDTPGRLRFRAVADGEIDRELLKEKIVLVLGAPATNRISGELNRQLPFRVQPEGLRIEEKTYVDSAAWLFLPLYPSPFNRQLPVIWITGGSDVTIAAEMEKKLDQGWSPIGGNTGGYEIFREGERILLGVLRERDWRPDPNLQFDFLAVWDTVLESAHYRVLSGANRLPDLDLQAMTAACESSAEAIRDFTGQEHPLARFDLFLYPSAEEKGLRLHNTDQAQIDFDRGAVHLVYNDIYRHNYTGKENELLLRRLLGRPQTIALERGLAVRFTRQWQRQGYQYWANLLFRSGNLPPLSELMDNDRFTQGSDLVMEPAAASFVDFLLEKWGREVFLTRYPEWTPNAAEIAHWQQEWHEALARHARGFSRVVWSREELPVLRGFNFSHEGYAIYNGYISRMAAESLDRMAELGSNAAAIIPYSYLRDPQKPAPLPVSNRPGSENDESVINALHAAKRRGMLTILKPQIWLGGGRWPGDVMMQNEADWQAFFQYYYEWIRHYALLAEIHQVDVLVIGTEFAQATLARESDWVELIRKIRRLYGGKITYAANWGEEFEKVGFWKELDYLGLDCYYPLSDKEEASYTELDANFRKILQKIEQVQRRYDKPLLFTETGFRSIPAPWRAPYAHAGDAGYHGEHQQMCYEIVLKNLAGKDWLQGVLFWKWPSYLESRGRENTDYFPVDKPAEGVVREWFGRMGE